MRIGIDRTWKKAYFSEKQATINSMIAAFRCKHTKALFEGNVPSRFQAFSSVALRKLDMLDAAACLEDLRVPPANHLEALKGDRMGQHSIRINGQWRVCFVWRDGAAWDVEIVDYHK